MDRQNLTLLTDLYELTMMQGYFKHKDENKTVIFDAFFRTNPFGGGYSIMCGVEQLVKYVKELHFSEEDIAYLKSVGIFDEDFWNTAGTSISPAPSTPSPKAPPHVPQRAHGQGHRPHHGGPSSWRPPSSTSSTTRA